MSEDNNETNHHTYSVSLKTLAEQFNTELMTYLQAATKEEGFPAEDVPDELLKPMVELALVEIEDDKIFFKFDKLVIRNQGLNGGLFDDF